MTDTTTDKHRWTHILHAWPALIAMAGACFALSSPDVPLGLAWGRAIYEQGSLPATNIFSHMHPDWPVQLDKWLFQLGIYLVHLSSGPTGLVLLKLALVLTAFFAATKAARVEWMTLPHAMIAVCFAIALLNRCYLRAELVTWAAIPITMCLMPGISKGSKKAWALMILTQAVWANSHGYWVIGPMLWAAAGLGLAIQPLLTLKNNPATRSTPDSTEIKRLFLAVPFSLAAACLTPYGIKTLAHPFRLAFELGNQDILARAVDDFGTPLEAIRRGGTIPMWACCLLGLAGVAATLWTARHKTLNGQHLAVFTLGCVLGLPLYRNLTILALCALPIVVQAVTDQTRARTVGSFSWRYSFAALPAIFWLGTVISGWGPATDYGARKPGFGWHSQRYPMAAANWIALNKPQAKLWNELTTGGWLNWRLGEGHTYIDGNTDGYPLSFLEDTHEAWFGADIQPWFDNGDSHTVALVEYNGSDNDLARCLLSLSWSERPVIAYRDHRYCIVLNEPENQETYRNMSTAFMNTLQQLIISSPLASEFSLDKLTSVLPTAPHNMYVRSGRIALWLYPDNPRAQTHYANTRMPIDLDPSSP